MNVLVTRLDFQDLTDRIPLPYLTLGSQTEIPLRIIIIIIIIIHYYYYNYSLLLL